MTVISADSDLFQQFREHFLAHGGNPTHLDLLGLPAVKEDFSRLIAEYAEMLAKSYRIKVDYRMPWEEMLAKCGCEYNDSNITATNFPIIGGVGRGIVEYDLFPIPFGRVIESDEVVLKIPKLKLSLGRIEHAFALGAQFPALQREEPVVFLGSVWSHSGDQRFVPSLDVWGSLRYLSLCGWRVGWDRRCRFAAVREVLPEGTL